MSLAAPTGLSLTQGTASVTATWNAVTGATYFLIQRYEAAATYADRITVGTSTSTTFTDPAVPVIVDSGSGFVQAQWTYVIFSADASGVYNGASASVTMAQTTTTAVQSFDVSNPILKDGTQYDYANITFTSTAADPDQGTRDSVLISYLKTIGA